MVAWRPRGVWRALSVRGEGPRGKAVEFSGAVLMGIDVS